LTIVRVPFALPIAFLAALFNLVPYLGPIVGMIPAVLLGFTVSPLTALLGVIVFVVANQIEGNILAPYILSKSTNLHPVTVLLAILVGAGLFGLLGALLAVPVSALLKVILEEYLLKRPAYKEPAIALGQTAEPLPVAPLPVAPTIDTENKSGKKTKTSKQTDLP
jgi:predicted PurR-regulated permease PerM